MTPTMQRPQTTRYSLCVQIETQQAVDHIDEILSVPGIDAVMIGPNDLSLSLGVFTQWESPKFKDAIGKIRDSCIRNGVAPGIVAMNDVEKRLEEGFRFFQVTQDTIAVEQLRRRGPQAMQGTVPLIGQSPSFDVCTRKNPIRIGLRPTLTGDSDCQRSS